MYFIYLFPKFQVYLFTKFQVLFEKMGKKILDIILTRNHVAKMSIINIQ